MNEFDPFEKQFDTPPEVTLPEKCRDCGVQCALRDRIVGLYAVKQHVEQAAGSLIGEAGADFDAMVDSQLPADDAVHIKQAIRRSTGNRLTAVDQAIEEATTQIDTNARGCSGPLKMRATKGDVTYTVSICTAPTQYVRDGDPATLPAIIKADSANKF